MKKMTSCESESETYNNFNEYPPPTFDNDDDDNDNNATHEVK